MQPAGVLRADPPGARPCLFGFRAERLRLRDPSVDAPGQSHFLAHIVGGFRTERRDLPIMEDAQIVELLLDRGGYAGELGEIVGDAARTGERLETERLLGRP